MGMAKHLTSNPGQMTSNAAYYHMYSQPREGGHSTTRDHMGVALENRVNNQRLLEGGFVVSRRRGDPWFQRTDVVGLFE